MVLMVALHSQLEYPLWYPTSCCRPRWPGACAWRARRSAAADALRVAACARCSPSALLMLPAAACSSIVDYRASRRSSRRAETRRRWRSASPTGQRSVFFAHHADYAAATAATPHGVDGGLRAARRTTCSTRA